MSACPLLCLGLLGINAPLGSPHSPLKKLHPHNPMEILSTPPPIHMCTIYTHMYTPHMPHTHQTPDILHTTHHTNTCTHVHITYTYKLPTHVSATSSSHFLTVLWQRPMAHATPRLPERGPLGAPICTQSRHCMGQSFFPASHVAARSLSPCLGAPPSLPLPPSGLQGPELFQPP